MFQNCLNHKVALIKQSHVNQQSKKIILFLRTLSIMRANFLKLLNSTSALIVSSTRVPIIKSGKIIVRVHRRASLLYFFCHATSFASWYFVGAEKCAINRRVHWHWSNSVFPNFCPDSVAAVF